MVAELSEESVRTSLVDSTSGQDGGPISGGGEKTAATTQTPVQMRNTVHTPTQRAPTREISLPVGSKDEEGEDERPPRSNPPSNKKNQSNSASSKLQLLTEDMLRSPLSSVGCRTCGKRIKDNFIARQEHCSKEHMSADHSDEEYTELLEASMSVAFPGLDYNEKQCIQCLKEYNRLDEKERHVMNTHWSQTLACPVPNCYFLSVEITSHMKEMHKKYPNGFADLPRVIYNQFMQRRNEYKTRLDQAVNECFPAPLRPASRKKNQVGGTPSLASAILADSSDAEEENKRAGREQKKKEKKETAPKKVKLAADEQTDENESDVEVLEKGAQARKNTAEKPIKTEPELNTSHSVPGHASTTVASPFTAQSFHQPRDIFAGRTGCGSASCPIIISDSDGEEEGNTVQTVEIEVTDEEDKENVEGEDGLEYVPPLKPKLAVIQPPHLTMNQYNNLISNKTKNLFGGKMTDERVNNISRVTEDLVGLQNLLLSNATLVIVSASVVYQWKEELEDRVEPGLLNILVFHGPKREKQAKRVVRHDVVITIYDTVRIEMTVKVDLTNDSDSEEEEEEEEDQASRRGKKKVRTKVRSDKKSVSTAIAWERVILDEAHNIKNRNTLISRAVCKIPATYRWCLTDTPVHNNLNDLFSLIRFLRVRPFNEFQGWMQYIMANNLRAADRLNTLTKSLLLRRTKEMADSSTGKPIVALKQKLFETHELEFTGLEKSIYDHLMKVSRQKVLKLMADMDGASNGFPRRRKKELGAGEKLANPFLGGPREVSATDKFQAMSCVLTLLLRLRQAAVHLGLTRDAVVLEAFEGLGTGDGTEEQALAAEVADITLDKDAEMAVKVGASAEEVEKVFKKKFKSAKIVTLLDLLDEVVKSGDKCFIVSQWTSLLDLVEYHIRRRVEYTSIDGAVPVTDRQERVNSFNRTDGGTQVPAPGSGARERT